MNKKHINLIVFGIISFFSFLSAYFLRESWLPDWVFAVPVLTTYFIQSK